MSLTREQASAVGHAEAHRLLYLHVADPECPPGEIRAVLKERTFLCHYFPSYDCGWVPSPADVARRERTHALWLAEKSTP